MVERRPFHETIVDAIRLAQNVEELLLLGILIDVTKIPKNHDGILAAWNNKWRKIGETSDSGVPQILLVQKREAEAEDEALAKKVLSPKNIDKIAERLQLPREPFNPDET